jgi:hypothetical protein
VPFTAPTPTRTGGAVRADALPSALAGATEYSVYAWARLDAVNGAEMPVVSTWGAATETKAVSGIVAGCFVTAATAADGGCEWGVRVASAGPGSGSGAGYGSGGEALTLSSGVEASIGEWVLLYAAVGKGTVSVVVSRAETGESFTETRSLTAEETLALRPQPAVVDVATAAFGNKAAFFSGAIAEVNVFDSALATNDVIRMVGAFFCTPTEVVTKVGDGNAAAGGNAKQYAIIERVEAPAYDDRSWANEVNRYSDAGFPAPSLAGETLTSKGTHAVAEFSLLPWGAMRLHHIEGAAGVNVSADLLAMAILPQGDTDGLHLYAGTLADSGVIGRGAVALGELASLNDNAWARVIAPLAQLGAASAGEVTDIILINKGGRVATFAVDQIALLAGDALDACPNELSCVAADPAAIGAAPPVAVFADGAPGAGFADVSYGAAVGEGGVVQLEPFGAFQLAMADRQTLPAGELRLAARSDDSAALLLILTPTSPTGAPPVRVPLAGAMSEGALAVDIPTGIASIAIANNADAPVLLDVDSIVFQPRGDDAPPRCHTVSGSDFAVPAAGKARGSAFVPAGFVVGNAAVSIEVGGTGAGAASLVLEHPASGMRTPLVAGVGSSAPVGSLANATVEAATGRPAYGEWRVAATAAQGGAVTVERWELTLCE